MEILSGHGQQLYEPSPVQQLWHRDWRRLRLRRHRWHVRRLENRQFLHLRGRHSIVCLRIIDGFGRDMGEGRS